MKVFTFCIEKCPCARSQMLISLCIHRKLFSSWSISLSFCWAVVSTATVHLGRRNKSYELISRLPINLCVTRHRKMSLLAALGFLADLSNENCPSYITKPFSYSTIRNCLILEAISFYDRSQCLITHTFILVRVLSIGSCQQTNYVDTFQRFPSWRDGDNVFNAFSQTILPVFYMYLESVCSLCLSLPVFYLLQNRLWRRNRHHGCFPVEADSAHLLDS